MSRTVSLQQPVGKEVVIRILSIGTLPSPAMMSQEGMGTYAQQLTIFMGYGIRNLLSHRIGVCLTLPLGLADSLADMTSPGRPVIRRYTSITKT